MHDHHNHEHNYSHDNHTYKDGIIHHGNFKEEFFCHFPYAIFSVALSMICLSLLTQTGYSPKTLKHLFHDFHFLHLVFSGTGAVLVFRKYSKSISLALVVGIVVPVIFCTLSDSLLPYIGGQYLGLNMGFHWCFLSHIKTVSVFLLMGIINGFVVSSHPSSKQLFYSASAHFTHIFISSMASMLYFASFGLSNLHHQIAFVFIFLILAVLIPCTLADIVIPMLCALASNKYELRKNKKIISKPAVSLNGKNNMYNQYSCVEKKR